MFTVLVKAGAAPIPTLPALSNIIPCILFVLNFKGWRSVVPIKSVLGVVPALPDCIQAVALRKEFPLYQAGARPAPDDTNISPEFPALPPGIKAPLNFMLPVTSNFW